MPFSDTPSKYVLPWSNFSGPRLSCRPSRLWSLQRATPVIGHQLADHFNT
jgi:hypothetical protein